MNVASLELCKELYELSGWNETDYLYTIVDADFEPQHTVSYYLHIGKSKDLICPAYDLGYMLRKLPKHFKTDDVRGAFQFYLLPFEVWVAGYAKPEYGQFYKGNARFIWGNAKAETPEDAACKLAIELFKQGVLKAAQLNALGEDGES